jgi:hypothetical protein
MECPICKSEYVQCPECYKKFKHGTKANCDNPECMTINAPLDCRCGFIVSADLKGILDFDMNLMPYKEV